MTALLASLLVLSATPSKAQQAADLAHRSMAEYNVGRFDAALEDATNAYLLDPRPGFLYNIGQCQRALHHWERAEFFYRGYLRDKPDAPNRKAVEELVAEMQGKQKEEEAVAATAAAQAKPAEVSPAPIIVEAPPAPAPAAAPTAAVTAPTAPPPHHGHTLAICLGSVGVVMLGLTVASVYEVLAYNSTYVSGANSAPGTVTFDKGQQSSAKFFQDAEWVAGGLAIAGFASAALTW